jgi:hypothetical protein
MPLDRPGTIPRVVFWRFMGEIVSAGGHEQANGASKSSHEECPSTSSGPFDALVLGDSLQASFSAGGHEQADGLSARRMAPEVGFGGAFPYIYLKVSRLHHSNQA